MQWCRMAMGSGDVKNVEIKGGKMKPEDVEFIRDEHVKVETCRNIDCETCPERSTFLRLLTESEAMRGKAEFWVKHQGWKPNYHTRTDPYESCRECGMTDPRHQWSDADWITAKKKEWGI